MKLCSSLLFAAVALAQGGNDEFDAADRWGGYGNYYDYEVGNGGKNDGGQGYGINQEEITDDLHFNGLYCWMCDERLDLGTATESDQSGVNVFNAYTRCLTRGKLMRCRGEQRSCMFEERRRHGVVYSVCTGCKQTDACLALWRRNQRFTLPFMNFGDQSVMHLQDGRPQYVDDECTTYQMVDDSEVSIGAEARTNFGRSYAKFSYDSTSATQQNSQMSQWESSCRWCCAAKHDNICNLDATNYYSSPFATKCGPLDNSNSGGTIALLASSHASIPSLTNSHFSTATCTLSNAMWTGGDVSGMFVFFQPFQLSEVYGVDQAKTAGTQWIHDFVRTALRDMSGTDKQPVTGEGRNSMGMDKYKYRGNSYDQTTGWREHYFEHQSDMLSQENRDMFDRRADQAAGGR